MSMNFHGWHGAVPLRQVQGWQESCSVPLPNKDPGENRSKHPPFKSWIKGLKKNGHNKLLVVVMLIFKLFKPMGSSILANFCHVIEEGWEKAYLEPTNQISLSFIYPVHIISQEAQLYVLVISGVFICQMFLWNHPNSNLKYLWSTLSIAKCGTKRSVCFTPDLDMVIELVDAKLTIWR